MSAVARLAVAPAYLALCLLVGGSAQGVWGNLLLQLLAILILAWALLTRDPQAGTRSARLLGWLGLAAVGVVLLQLVPMPPALWTVLPGREPIAAGYRMLGVPLPWLPISLAPYDTLAAALPLLPPLAVLASILRLGASRTRWVAAAIVGGTLAGVALGALQVTASSGYLYAFTSRGRAAGFFANATYMGTLLLAALPFLTALFLRYRKETGSSDRRRLGLTAVAIGAAAVLLLGLLLNDSIAALLLSVPVLLGCTVMLVRNNERARRWVLAGAIVAGLAGPLAVASVPRISPGDAALSASIRKDIWERSLAVAGDHFPVGSGLGTFPRLYPRYEDADSVDWVYVNHVHNDYLEVVIEMGLAGAVLALVFLLWWIGRCIAIWRSPGSGGFAQAASIASAAILAHSMVDFPIRTAAIAAVLAACVALMAEPRPRRARDESGIRARPARHLSLG